MEWIDIHSSLILRYNSHHELRLKPFLKPAGDETTVDLQTGLIGFKSLVITSLMAGSSANRWMGGEGGRKTLIHY